MPATAPELRPRDPHLAFDPPPPRHWLGGRALATHVANGANLLFPLGERFFVRSVRRFKDRVKDPALAAKLRGFYGQEGLHARETERFLRALEAQGYDVQRFLAIYDRIAYGFIERVAPASLSLAVTVALEHFTAILAEDTLKGGVLDEAPEELRKLLLWHSAEEIEHRAVAFDVLREVDDAWALRMAGLALGAACLGGFWMLATTMLLAQEEDYGPRKFLSDLGHLRRRRKGRSVFFRGLRAYLRPDFHPSDADLDRLAADYLAAAGLA